MLHFHKKLGSYTQFGGHIELHETPWLTLIHELQEETGYDISQLQILQPHQRIPKITGSIIHPYPVAHNTMGYASQGNHFHIDTVYALITNEEPRQAPNEGESTNIKLFSKQELIKAQDLIDPAAYDIALYIFDEILESWEAIPTNKFK